MLYLFDFEVLRCPELWKNIEMLYGKNFVKVFKKLDRYRDENNFVESSKYNYIRKSRNAAKCFDILATSSNVLYNYFDKIIFRSVKFLNTLTKLSFPYNNSLLNAIF